MKCESVELYTAIGNVQQNVGKIKKSSDNPYFNSKYADLPTIWEKIKAELNSNGLVVSQHPVSTESGMGLETIIIHIGSGQMISSTVSSKTDTSNPQKMGSAITYLRRYALCSILGLQVDDEDDDGNKASEPKTRRTSAPAAPEKVIDANADLFLTDNQKKMVSSALSDNKVTPPEFKEWLKLVCKNPKTGKSAENLDDIAIGDYQMVQEYAAKHSDKIKSLQLKDGTPAFIGEKK